MTGNSDNGGAANVNWNHPDNSNDNIGFRVAVVLSFEENGLLYQGQALFAKRA